MPTLLLLFFTPVVLSAVLFLLKDVSSVKLKALSFIFSLLPLLLMLTTTVYGTSVDYPWFPALSIHFHLAVDNLSLLFLYLVNAIVPMSILATQNLNRPHLFYGLVLLLQALLNAFFSTQDLAFFAFFFEAILIPLYFIINGWGHDDRQKASTTFIIYMIAGSFLMVAALFAIYVFGPQTFNLQTLTKSAETIQYAPYIAFIFLLAFAVKTPLFPFHSWLPDAYCQAPTAGSILLAALLSKAGIYGILRILFGLFPTIIASWSALLLPVAIIGVLYGAFCAWGQNDFKRLIAYSSFSHVNFVLAGLFLFNEMGVSGAIFQAINHALTITALFFAAGWLEERLGTTQFGEVSGLAAYMPRLAWLTLFFVLSSVALPGLNNFVSEAMVLYGCLQKSIWIALLLGVTVIVSILYMLRWIHSLYFNNKTTFHKHWTDLHAKELITAFPLIAFILWFGIFPAPVLAVVMPVAKNFIGISQ